MTAPRVVQSFHSTDMNSTGKLADAAIANARRHHERDVLLLEHDAEQHRQDAQRHRGDARHPQLGGAVGLAAS